VENRLDPRGTVSFVSSTPKYFNPLPHQSINNEVNTLPKNTMFPLNPVIE